MSGGALGTAGALSAAGFTHYGVGAVTSMCLTGPMMDVALLGAVPGWQVYLRLLVAGLASNLVAFMQRGGSKLLDFDQPGTRLFQAWFSQAMVTYTLSGAVAGLIGALCWFEFQSRPAPPVRSADQVVYVGIDDTDIAGSPGTNQLARAIVKRLGATAKGAVICRHQLFLDSRVPYTSKNGSASIRVAIRDERGTRDPD